MNLRNVLVLPVFLGSLAGAAAEGERCAASRAELLGGRLPEVVDAGDLQRREQGGVAVPEKGGRGCLKEGRWYREGALYPPQRAGAMTLSAVVLVCTAGGWRVSGR